MLVLANFIWLDGKWYHDRVDKHFIILLVQGKLSLLTNSSYLSKIWQSTGWLLVGDREFGNESHTQKIQLRYQYISHIIHPKGWKTAFLSGWSLKKRFNFRSFWPDTVAFISYALTMNGHIDAYPIGVSCHASVTENMPFHVHPLDAFPLWNTPYLFHETSLRVLFSSPNPRGDWHFCQFQVGKKWNSPARPSGEVQKWPGGIVSLDLWKWKWVLVLLLYSYHGIFAVVGLYMSCRGW